jgi:hypothetical protein
VQNAAWLELLRLLPEAQHQNLLIMTADASEVFVSDIVRMEPEYLVLRGRVGGTSDTGLVFFVPYDRIAFVRLQKPVPEELVYGLYGMQPPERKAVEADPGAEAGTADESDDQAADRSTPARGVNRQELLERLRLRQQHGPGSRPTPVEGTPRLRSPGGGTGSAPKR